MSILGQFQEITKSRKVRLIFVKLTFSNYPSEIKVNKFKRLNLVHT